MSTDATCCRRSAYYNIRRYDPLGRTLWVRDYFQGYTGQHFDPAPMPCRCSVDLVNDRIYVSGPVVWTNEHDLKTYWNAACYTISGNLLWRRRFKFDDTSGGGTDVVTVNGRHFIMVEQPEAVGPIPNLENMVLIEFDKNGNQLDLGFSLGQQDIGPRFLKANPDHAYDVPSLHNFATGITTFGWGAVGIGASAAYVPADDAFVVGVPPENTGAVFDIVWKTRSHDTHFTGGSGIVGHTWIEGAVWGIQNNPGDLFGVPSRVWTIPREMTLGPGSDVICATDFASYFRFNGDLVSPGERLGTGSLVRLDADGNPVWFRGLHAMGCLDSDSDGRLYSGSLIGFSQFPSVARWTMDGEFMWGHSHNSIEQVAIVGDAGIVTVGNRSVFGRGETNWVTEGSFGG